MDLYAVGVRKTLLPLALSGLFFGMGVACKWIGLYAGVGLAILFAVYWYRRFREYEEAKRKQHSRKSAGSKEMLERYSHIVRLFPKYAKKIVIWSILFFILVSNDHISAVIYSFYDGARPRTWIGRCFEKSGQYV